MSHSIRLLSTTKAAIAKLTPQKIFTVKAYPGNEKSQ